ncbi:hypothetical protein [Salipiger mucosus]|uniref:Uncharacterized protein n=1 Tax=Salipiger mucosus DSM 16094 TaxID=1123237 RepID=S9RF62_9RHOB|nr:hypothetical protein [Salipiger mucosus]EPX76750.1 hypothetical protein Salmuc_04635 [Salipiger mucosus DSM 16094]
MHEDFDGHLYHATPRSKLDEIMETGLRAGTCLAVSDIAAYYAEDIEDEGEEPVILKIAFEDLDATALAPDMPSIEEPISTVVGSKEDEIWERWDGSDQDWQDCMQIVGSLVSKVGIPAMVIVVDEEPAPAP